MKDIYYIIFFIGLLILGYSLIINHNNQIKENLDDIKNILNYLDNKIESKIEDNKIEIKKDNKIESKKDNKIENNKLREDIKMEDIKMEDDKIEEDNVIKYIGGDNENKNFVDKKRNLGRKDLEKIKNELIDIKNQKNQVFQTKLKEQFKKDYIDNATTGNLKLFDNTLNKERKKENDKKINEMIDAYKPYKLVNKEMFNNINNNSDSREILLSEENINNILKRLDNILGNSNKNKLIRAWENMCYNNKIDKKQNEFEELKLDLNEKMGDLVAYNDKLEDNENVYNLEPYDNSDTEEYGNYLVECD